MYRKNNPWVALVAALLLAIILVFVCTGCAVQARAAAPDRFSIEYGGDHNGLYAWVLTDNTTGQEYLFVKDGDASGLVKMEG